jgi:hypothetical protein
LQIDMAASSDAIACLSVATCNMYIKLLILIVV